MNPFSYSRPTTIDDAIALLDANASDGQADLPRLLAGGTDLLTLIKAGIAAPSQLIDIKRLAGLDDTIDVSGNDTRIGALTTLAQLEDDPGLRQRHPALAEAAAPQLRTMATIGGNLLQRPRCWYFRDDSVHCWLKGGDECPAQEGESQHHALFGGGPCYATRPSDLATALVALGASVTIRGHGHDGERALPLEEFFVLPTPERRRENVLAQSDVVTGITIPAVEGARSTYLKAMDRKVWAFAQVGIAAMLVTDGQTITAARLVLGGVAPTPWRATEAEAVLSGATTGPDIFTRAAGVALEGAQPLLRNAYKIPLAKAMIARALAAASA